MPFFLVHRGFVEHVDEQTGEECAVPTRIAAVRRDKAAANELAAMLNAQLSSLLFCEYLLQDDNTDEGCSASVIYDRTLNDAETREHWLKSVMTRTPVTDAERAAVPRLYRVTETTEDWNTDGQELRQVLRDLANRRSGGNGE